jgi:mannose-6-phosphate isomerase
MLKILDAADDLSVQVHPSDAQVTAAQRAQGHRGKTESWVVLDAAADAQVLWGTKTAMRLDEARQVAARGELHRVLKHVPVEAGSVIHNPAGTVHAVGRGLKIFELQQASDVTYRLDDYGRKGADGRTRDLHLEAGLAVADLSAGGDPHPHVEPGAPAHTLVACEHYLLRDLTI